MVIKNSIHFLLFIAVVSNVSCTSTAGLYRSLSSKNASLKYIYDSDVRYQNAYHNVTIAKPEITDRRFSKSGRVTKTQAYFVPVIVYNEWKSIHHYEIGESAIQEDIPTFIQSAFVEESTRNGSFVASTTSLPDALTLEIEIDSIGATGPHVQKGFIFYGLFMYVTASTEVAGPGTAYSQFHYRLMKNDSILLEDRVNSRKVTEPLISRHGSTKVLRQAYTMDLVEALSQTFKSNIQLITNDIGVFLRKNENN